MHFNDIKYLLAGTPTAAGGISACRRYIKKLPLSWQSFIKKEIDKIYCTMRNRIFFVGRVSSSFE